MEELCRQICVIYDIDKKKADKIINVLHIVTMILRLVAISVITFILLDLFELDQEAIIEFLSKPKLFEIVDTNELSSVYYLFVIMIFIGIIVLVTNIIDLVLNRERTLSQLLFIALVDFSFFVIILRVYTNYSLAKILGASLLEPIIYVLIVCIAYIKMQYNNKIYHKMQANEQLKNNNRINLSKREK